MKLIDGDALVDALMTYTWRDEDERLIDDADEKREYIKQWLPDLPTIGGWVSVKDRLPEVGGKYLIRDKTDVTIGTLMLIDKRNGLWQWADSDFYGRGGITHWMPIPPGPEVKDEV